MKNNIVNIATFLSALFENTITLTHVIINSIK